MPLIHFLPGDAILLKGLDDANLNGTEAVLLEREQRRKLWVVRLASGREVHVKHKNLEHKTSVKNDVPKDKVTSDDVMRKIASMPGATTRKVGTLRIVEVPGRGQHDDESDDDESDDAAIDDDDAPMAPMGTHASLDLHPYSGYGSVKLSAAPATRDAPHVDYDTFPGRHDKPLAELMTENWQDVTAMLGDLHMTRNMRFIVHHSLLKGVGGPGVNTGTPMVNVNLMTFTALTDIENIVVGAYQIAYAAYQMYNEEEFSHDSRMGPRVLWRADDEMTNIRVDIKFKGHDIRTRFIEHGGETHVAVCPVSAD